jgi:magnesium-transporting ATPase (P-type)
MPPPLPPPLLLSASRVSAERRADETLDELERRSKPSAIVTRDGKRTTVPITGVVVGDVIFIKAGAPSRPPSCGAR